MIFIKNGFIWDKSLIQILPDFNVSVSIFFFS